MKLFTIGYGGRSRDDFLGLLMKNGVRTVVDVRLRPDRASMGIWVKAKTSDKGIERMLTDVGIGYMSLIELGNVFLAFSDWQERYRQLLDVAGELLMTRLANLPEPLCLLCAEKLSSECHRQEIAAYLAKLKGYDVRHLG
jgi:uncharacterized protein (DUF488 family)